VYARPFLNQADQFNWALERAAVEQGWILRIDADEVVDAELLASLQAVRQTLPGAIRGYSMVRRIHFLGRTLRFGGLGSIRIVRLFAAGSGRSEQRWMDEHIVVDGVVGELDGLLIDHNLNSLSWWIAKHNQYASREVIDLCLPERSTDAAVPHGTARLKRWLKHAVFYRLPPTVAPALYFLLRYFLMLGFLDGRPGVHYHFHQAFWYRTLVQSKLDEVRLLRSAESITTAEALQRVTGYDVINTKPASALKSGSPTTSRPDREEIRSGSSMK
jgi:hypothetical protein